MMYVTDLGFAMFIQHCFAFGKKRMEGEYGVHGYYTCSKTRCGQYSTFRFFNKGDDAPLFYIVHNKHGYTCGNLSKHNGKYFYSFGLGEKWRDRLNLHCENYSKHHSWLKGFVDSFHAYQQQTNGKAA